MPQYNQKRGRRRFGRGETGSGPGTFPEPGTEVALYSDSCILKLLVPYPGNLLEIHPIFRTGLPPKLKAPHSGRLSSGLETPLPGRRIRMSA